MSIKIENLTKIYSTQKAVDNISFEAKQGQIVGFLGPNGAGKSTTMKIATCYIPPTSGKVKVCDYDVISQAMEVRKNVGYLPEHNPLYLDMYVPEALYFAASIFGIKGKKLLNRTEEIMSLVGLENEKHKKVSALSKGYRQRLGLAQALIHDPQVLILDEPTTGLDPNQIVEIRQVIKNISKNKTVLLSTHLMQEVEALCERVLIINKGKLVADNIIGELKSTQKQSFTIVEFASSINTDFFYEIPNINAIEKIGDNLFQLSSDENTDIRAEVFKKAVQRNVVILSLYKKDVSLEKVFQQLTNQSA
ncbi:MAG: gliding motility-associated ABC transporter ATP-binding subunit GldA [Flammeovirgaceae bacterium]